MADTLTIDGITYPNTFDAVVKDNRIAKAYATHCKKAGRYESFKFILTRFDPDVHFVEFIFEGAPSQINISDKVRNQMLELAKSTDEKDWKASNWSGLVNQAKNELRLMMNINTLTGNDGNFFKSDDFYRIHNKVAAQQSGAPEITKSNYTSIAKSVGYANPADILTREFLDDRGMIELLIGHQRGGRAAESKKLIAALKERAQERNQGTVIGEEAVDKILNTDFESKEKEMKELLEFGNTEPGPNAIEININKKLLNRFFMELMDDKKSMQMLNDTVQAYVTGKTTEAKQLFEKMRKRYPKNHALHAGSVKALILALKRAKLIEAVKI